MVENRCVETGVARDAFRDINKKDAKTLFFIQQDVDDVIFSLEYEDEDFIYFLRPMGLGREQIDRYWCST